MVKSKEFVLMTSVSDMLYLHSVMGIWRHLVELRILNVMSFSRSSQCAGGYRKGCTSLLSCPHQSNILGKIWAILSACSGSYLRVVAHISNTTESVRSTLLRLASSKECMNALNPHTAECGESRWVYLQDMIFMGKQRETILCLTTTRLIKM